MNLLAAVSHLLKISSTAVKTITPPAQKIVCIFPVGKKCQELRHHLKKGASRV
jgi:hypothetical protein